MMKSVVAGSVVLACVAFGSAAWAQSAAPSASSSAQIKGAEVIFAAPQTDRPEHWVGALVFDPSVQGYCLDIAGNGGALKRLCSKNRDQFFCLEALHRIMGDKADSLWVTYRQVAGISVETGRITNKYVFRVQGSDMVRCTM